MNIGNHNTDCLVFISSYTRFIITNQNHLDREITQINVDNNQQGLSGEIDNATVNILFLIS